MQLELGQLIIDTMQDTNDVGLVVGIEEGTFEDETIYRIYWTCRRDYGNRDYTTEILYSEEELKMEYSQNFVVVEKNELFS